MPTNVLRLPAVMARTGFSRSAIYKMVAVGSFPRPVLLHVRAVGWIESDVEAWLQSRVAASRAQAISEGAGRS